MQDIAQLAAQLASAVDVADPSDVDGALAAMNEAITRLRTLAQEAECASGPPDASDPNGGMRPLVWDLEPEGPVSAENASLLKDFVEEARGHLETAEIEALKLEDDPSDHEALNAIFRSVHSIKGVAGFFDLKQIVALTHLSEAVLELVRSAQLRLDGAILDSILETVDSLKLLVDSLEQALKTGTPVPTQPGLPDLLRRLLACIDGQVKLQASAAPLTPGPHTPRPDLARPPGAPPGGRRSVVQIATDRLDHLIDTIGELVIAQLMVSEGVASLPGRGGRLTADAGRLAKITRELQTLSLSMRMVPIQRVFQRMARVARDLSRKLGKEIDFVVTGAQTELDRNLVETLADPLVHMIRNAVDHGIESPRERTAAGKPAAGRIELSACHRAGAIVIVVSDDGRGLDTREIRRKAVEAGIVEEARELTEQEIFRLIFHAGLSTSDAVTDVSGRGVGMDVVRRNVEALRGRIEIASAAGKGAVFTICLPLTLAVIDGLIVRAGGERYIVPTVNVEESVRPTADQLFTLQTRAEMCRVRDTLLPMFRLSQLFGLTPHHEDPARALVVVVQDNHRRCALLVDELLGQQQVVIKTLGAALGATPGISGGAILGDGSVSLILDVPGLIELASCSGTRAEPEIIQEGAKP